MSHAPQITRTHRSARRAALTLVLAAVAALVLGPAARAADPPVTSPPPGLQLWYEADSLTQFNGQRVTRWPDSSGNGRDLTAFSTSVAPVMRTNAVNGRDALEFDGVSSLMKTYGSTFSLGQPTTFFIVYRSLDANTSTRAFVFDSRNSGARQVFGRPGAGRIRLYANIDLDFPGVAYPFSGYEIWSGTFNGSSSDLVRNGVAVGSGNAGGSALDGLTVGGLSTSGQYGYDYSHVAVAEILIYSGALSAADRATITTYLSGKYSGPASPPANTALPSISGSAADGATLTAADGTWSGTQPITYSYEWRRCDSTGGACVAIGGATAKTYGLTGADVGQRLRVAVTGTNSAGNATAVSVATAVVAAAAPANTAAPAISGTTRSGSALTTTNGTWTGSAPITYSYAWLRCNGSGASCVAIGGAAQQSYNLTDTDVGSTIRAQVTATNAVGSASAQSSASQAIGAAVGSGGTPPVTAGLQLWYEAEGAPYANGARVTTWSDGSGFGRDLTAFDTNSAPVFRAGAVNGRDAVEFDGVSQLLKTYGSTFTLAQPTTFFVVYRSLDPTTTSARAFLFDSMNSSSRQAFGRPGSDQVRMYANIDLDFAGFSYPFSGFSLFAGVFDGGNSALYQNGNLVGSGNTGGASQAGFTLGGLSSGAQYGYDMSHAQVAELLYYSGSLSAADRGAVSSWLTQKYALSSSATPPSSASAPVISGTAADGATLTTSNGTWTGTPPMTYSYQWRRCDTSCTSIPNATGATYTAASADVGKTLTVVVTAANGAGSASATAAQTATVTPTAPAGTTGPSVSGTPQEGATLTTSDGTWSGTTPLTYTYAWQRCDTTGTTCTAIPGAVAKTYTVTGTDVGSRLRSRVTATNGAGSATAGSALTATIVAAGGTPPSSDPPVISGLQLWYDASDLTAANGARVSTWPDKSSFGRNLTAFDTNASPTLRANVLNGRNALEFDGASSLMKTYGSTFTLSQPTTFFVVYKALDTASTGFEAYLFDSRDSSVRQLFGLGPFMNTEMYANIDIEAPTTYPFPAYQIWSGTFDGNNSAVYRNNALVTQSPTGSAGLSGFTVGALSTSAQYGYHYGHNLVAEILYYSGTMTDAARAAMTDWLNQKYGVY